MSTNEQTIYAPGGQSKMAVVGIERRPDGVLVVHAPTPHGSPPRTEQVSGPQELWVALQALLDDPTLPRVTMENPETVSLQEALSAMAGDLLGNFVRQAAPAVAPHVQRVATEVARNASSRAGGLISSLGKADIGVPRYPRGS